MVGGPARHAQQCISLVPRGAGVGPMGEPSPRYTLLRRNTLLKHMAIVHSTPGGKHHQVLIAKAMLHTKPAHKREPRTHSKLQQIGKKKKEKALSLRKTIYSQSTLKCHRGERTVYSQVSARRKTDLLKCQRGGRTNLLHSPQRFTLT